MPPPAAADVALEELRKALIKRQTSTHLFIVPRLLTPEWRRQLNKAADLMFFVDPGPGYWPKDMYEPLTFGFVFPFLTVPPWQLRSTPKMLQLARTLPKLLQASDMVAGNILRELCDKNRQLSSMSGPMVWRLLHFGGQPGPIPH
jgi:hypothetical protein